MPASSPSEPICVFHRLHTQRLQKCPPMYASTHQQAPSDVLSRLAAEGTTAAKLVAGLHAGECVHEGKKKVSGHEQFSFRHTVELLSGGGGMEPHPGHAHCTPERGPSRCVSGSAPAWGAMPKWLARQASLTLQSAPASTWGHCSLQQGRHANSQAHC